jgi:hypothetical protein
VSAARVLLGELPDGPGVARARLDLVVAQKVLVPAPPTRGNVRVARSVAASTRGVIRMTITPQEQEAISLAPKRVQTQIRRMFELGWFDHARAELVAGRNPADKGWKHVLCAALLTGQMSRADLQMAFQTQLDLVPASAKVKLSDAMAVFAAGRLVIEIDGRVRFASNHPGAL